MQNGEVTVSLSHDGSHSVVVSAQKAVLTNALGLPKKVETFVPLPVEPLKLKIFTEAKLEIRKFQVLVLLGKEHLSQALEQELPLVPLRNQEQCLKPPFLQILVKVYCVEDLLLSLAQLDPARDVLEGPGHAEKCDTKHELAIVGLEIRIRASLTPD